MRQRPETLTCIGRAVLAVCLAAAAGCSTLGTSRQIEQARRDADADNFRLELQRLNRRMAALEQDIQRLSREFEAREGVGRQNASRVEDRLATLDKAVESTGATLSRLRDEIVKDLSTRLETLLKGRSGSGRRTESGYWHTVERGQTLSEIAKEYGVAVEAIVRANDISNPDTVRVGTRLFIPDAGR